MGLARSPEFLHWRERLPYHHEGANETCRHQRLRCRRKSSLCKRCRCCAPRKPRNVRRNSQRSADRYVRYVRYLIRGGGRGPASKLALRSRVSCCEAKGSCRTSGEAPHRRAEPVPSAVGCLLMWPSAAEGWPFPIFAACCFRCLDLFKNVCHMRRP